MTKWLRTIVPLFALCLTGCVPFVLESGTTNFAASEYTFPLRDGNYKVGPISSKPAVIVNQPGHVEITLFDRNDTHTLIGGFIALKTPGHFIFQATDGRENGQPTSKKPGEGTMYIPLRIAATGEVSWYVGPKHCDPECAALLSSYGYLQDTTAGWSQPKNLPRAQMRAFYEDLAAMVERNPEAWEAIRAVRVDIATYDKVDMPITVDVGRTFAVTQRVDTGTGVQSITRVSDPNVLGFEHEENVTALNPKRLPGCCGTTRVLTLKAVAAGKASVMFNFTRRS
jgi:hypothetical protein